MLGQTLGRYKILEELGEGGMGMVYCAEHTHIGGMVALKVLKPEYTEQEDVVERFFNEARASGAINHPGIVKISDFDYHTDGSAFIVMELLQGESLQERVVRMGRIAVPAAVRIVRQCASALDAAHGVEIIHRDLKPGNIFLARDEEMEAGERAKILDFGIAKLAGNLTGGMLQTRTGSMMGTPMYMSPEQCRGAGRVSYQSDIYSLGCVLFRIICGRPPFTGDGIGDIIVGHMMEEPPLMHELEPSVSPALAAVVAKALAKEPTDRYASMAEFGTALRALKRAPTMMPVYDQPSAATARPVKVSAADASARPKLSPSSFIQPASRHTPQRRDSALPDAGRIARDTYRGVGVDDEPEEDIRQTVPMPVRSSGGSRTTVKMGQPGRASAHGSAPIIGATTLGGAASQQMLAMRSRRPRWMVAVALSALFVAAVVGGLLFADDTEEPITTSMARVAVADGMATGTADGAPGLASAEAELMASGEIEDSTSKHAEDEIESLLEQAKQALRDQEWALAQALADQMIGHAPDNEDDVAQRIAEAASKAAEQEILLTELREAVGDAEYQTAANRFDEMPEDSVYYDEAEIVYERAREAAIEQARVYQMDQACEKLSSLAAKVPPDWSEVGAVLATCEQAQEMTKAAEVAESGGAEAAEKISNDEMSDDDKQAAFDELMAEAERAYQAETYELAYRQCRKARQYDSRAQRARSLCGVAACRAKNVKGANIYYKLVSGKNKGNMKRFCRKYGIVLGAKDKQLSREINDPALTGR